MAALCDIVLRQSTAPSAEELLAALREWQAVAATTVAERASLPVVMQYALQQRLARLLKDLRTDVREYRSGQQLARKLIRSRKPMRRLLCRRPASIALHAMLDVLRDEHQHELLAALDALMQESGTSAARIRETQLHRQTVLTDQIERTASCLIRFQELDRHTFAESDDPLHRLFLTDPSGTYARLTAESRFACRQYTARLARRYRADEVRVARVCLDAANAAKDDAPRDHIGYHLFTPEGQQMLRLQLLSHSGRIRTTFFDAQGITAAIISIVLALCLGWIILDATQRLFPSLLCTVSVLPAAAHLAQLWLQRCFALPQPVMQIDTIGEPLRTLLVLPAVLSEPADAISAVRKLLIARDACPEGAIDLLLLADYDQNLSPHAADDAVIASTARAAVSAIDLPQMRALYLQRQRNMMLAPHGQSFDHGANGLLAVLNELLSRGECDAEFADATLPPSELHRRYAYVVVLNEDMQLMPDALPALIGQLEYPLTAEACSMLMLSSGGLSSASHPTVIYRPDTFVHDCADLPFTAPLSPGSCSSAHAENSRQKAACRPLSKLPDITPPTRFRNVYDLWRSAPWLNTVHRTQLYASVLPISALLLMLYGCVMQTPALLLLGLTAHILTLLWHRQPLRQIPLLPQHACLHLIPAVSGIMDMLRNRPYSYRRAGVMLNDRRLHALTNWVQFLCATILGGISLVFSPPEWPSLLAGLLFAAFPLAEMLPERSRQASPSPDETDKAFIRDIAGDAWRYFSTMLLRERHYLPPDSFQEIPPRGASDETSPAAIAGTLLSLVSACDLRLITPETMAHHAACIAETCSGMSRRHGLFYARYRTDSTEPCVPLYIESIPNGLICYAFLLTAQALRANLSAIAEEHRALPAIFDALADEMHLRDLYDDATHLFFERISLPGATGSGLHRCFASPALVLSFIAVMRREIPAEHLSQLDHTHIRTGYKSVLLSNDGSVADYALPALFLPCRNESPWADEIRQAMQLHCKQNKNGMCGLSSALSPEADAMLRSRKQSSGFPMLALHMPDSSTLYAPYAAALLARWCLPEGISSLRSMISLGIQGSFGPYDGYDAIQNSEISTRAYSSLHQAFLLCACAGLLGCPPSAHFAQLPGVAAWTSLMEHIPANMQYLAPLTVRRQAAVPESPDVSRAGERLHIPPDVHILGNADASALVTSDGYTIMRGETLLWTRFTGSAALAEGLRFFVSNGKRTIRIGTGGNAEFHTGHAILHETLGKLQIALRIAADPVSGTIHHLLDVSNLAANDRNIQIGSLLLPCLETEHTSVHTNITIDHPHETVLTASTPNNHGMLCHTLTCSAHMTDVRTATDTSSLDATLAHVLHASGDASPCMSYLCSAVIAGRKSVTFAFATSYCHDGIPDSMRQLPSDGWLSIARMYSCLQQRQLGIGAEQALTCLRAAPFLLWRGLPQQGAVGSLSTPQQELCALGIDIHTPLLLLSVRTEDCHTLVDECFMCVALLAERGFPAALCILCRSSALSESITTHLTSLPDELRHRANCTVLRADTLAVGIRGTLEATAALILDDERELSQQLRAISASLQPVPKETHHHAPVESEPELLYTEPYGGFLSSGMAYVHLAQPGDASPAAWKRMLSDRRFGTCLSAEGLLGSYAGPLLHTVITHHPSIPAEFFYIEANSRRVSPTLFPYGGGCTIRIQHSAGTTVWTAQSETFDMQLTAATLSGYSAGVRMLKIRNRSDTELHMTIYAAAIFSPGDTDAGRYTWITTFSGLAVATSPGCLLSGYICAADEDTSAETMSEAGLLGMLALHGAGTVRTESNGGNVALLSRQITLTPGSSGSTCYVIGAAHTADEIERTAEHVRTYGASACIRIMRQKLAQRLSRLTVSTPDAALDLMMNHLLPVFLNTVHPEQTPMARIFAAAASIYVTPRPMRARLLNACTHMTRTDPERLLLPLLTDWYIRRSGDLTILDALLPETDDMQKQRDTLAVRCTDILTGVTLDNSGLPKIDGIVSRLNGLRYIASLKVFAPYMPVALQQEAQRMANLVSDAVQHAPVEESPCLQACWAVFAGLSASVPEHISPANFTEAVTLLHALSMTGETQQAWQMVQWLNPVLHHNTHVPPWQPESNGSRMDSAWLYIAVLENLLGFTRCGDDVHMTPKLPPEWKKCSIQLHTGNATWNIDGTRACDDAQCDGIPLADSVLHVSDDGRIHQARFPAT